MSIRQPESKKAKGKRQKMRSSRAEMRRATRDHTFAFCLSTFDLTSVFDISHLNRPETPKELSRPLAVELRVSRLDQHEEAVARGEREARRVEDRMVRLRQPVQREHPEDGEEGRAENRALERDRDERGPTVIGLAADVDRGAEYLNVNVKQKTEP